MSDDEQRMLRAKLEEAQGELARSREQLVSAQVECKRLEEELAFARWALEERKAADAPAVKSELAKSRAECESLRKELARLAGLPRPKGPLQVVLMASTDKVQPLDEDDPSEVVAYVGFVVERDRTSRDVVRTRDLEFARAEVERIAGELNVPVEDLT
jgi:multidrug efflux pump subunit AcrA (membrane-fusion protein)